ncbi:MAG TPA: hypothetical protein PKY82_04500 [Pyrinomonadaceae bacterium]|nr:hypothetical protein [Pyrinomonadaceae bacterium]
MLKKSFGVLVLFCVLVSGFLTVSAHAKPFVKSVQQQEQTDKMSGGKMQDDKMSGNKMSDNKMHTKHKRKHKHKKLKRKMVSHKMSDNKMMKP